ncbi:hypothetical protein CPter291_1873 [Collimonas pratensis]|uniref:Uncharacterized protein n=1 Tax=Collimonas pratensis TaxID=279113 RepID=A0ABN4MBR5_9BURK|nr:hypothetical protein CPter291_1873 [Collimonas pratensis]
MLSSIIKIQKQCGASTPGEAGHTPLHAQSTLLTRNYNG